MAPDPAPRWASGPPSCPYRLRLYVAGSSPRSRRAIHNLRRICRQHLPDRTDLEVIDLYKETDRARDAQILGAPTLIKEHPAPQARLVGDLSDEARVLDALMISPR